MKFDWKKFQDQATGLLRRFPLGAKEPSPEAKVRSGIGAKAGTVAKRMARGTLHPIKNLRARAANTVRTKLINMAARRVIKTIEGGSPAFDQEIKNRFAGFAIGVWGATTAAAISLALSAAVSGQPREWMLPVLIVSGSMALWNLAAFLRVVNEFRHLEGNAQRRLSVIVASKVGLKGVVVIAMPIAALFALGIARLLLPVT
jgi:hypothetical protein